MITGKPTKAGSLLKRRSLTDDRFDVLGQCAEAVASL